MISSLISARDLSKRYRLGTSMFVSTDHVSEGQHDVPGGEVTAGAQPNSYRRIRDRWIWALEGVNFDLAEGELVGIVGPNGAGKSTLLKLLSRITSPTRGTADIVGRMGSLLEIGTGFNVELTGRENIYVNGLVMGMTRNEIKKHFDEIIDFAGIDDFVDTPLKRYSSGMIARLGFAVAAHLETNILVVDEVLAVGDIEFQRKCLARMRELASGQGRGVIFVSHNPDSVLDLCTRVVWLDDGRLRMEGDPKQVLFSYIGGAGAGSGSGGRLHIANRTGDGFLQFTSAEVGMGDGTFANQTAVGAPMVLRFNYATNRNDLITISFAMNIRDRHGRTVTSLSTKVRGQDFAHLSGNGTIECRVERCPLLPGPYTMDLEATWYGNNLLDALPQALSFEVVPGRFHEGGLVQSPEGFFYIDQEWAKVGDR